MLMMEQALIVLHHCVQENPRFEVYCRLNKDLLTSLVRCCRQSFEPQYEPHACRPLQESFEYTFEEGEDHGVEVRKEARRLAALLSDTPRLARIRSNSSSLKRRATVNSTSKSGRLRRRGAFYVRNGSSTSSQATAPEPDPFAGFDSVGPMTMSDRVRQAVSGLVEWSDAMENIRSIADQTTCP